MTESTIFEAPATPDAPVPTAPVVNPADQLLKTILNEQGVPKYNSTEDALRALAASQEHIKRIEQDNAALREANIKARAQEELLAALKPKDEPAPAAPSNPSQQPDLSTAIDAILTRREQEQIKLRNQTAVASKIKEVYGQEKASEVFYTKAQSLGFSRDAINNLAAENPNAVFKLLDISPTAPTPSLPGVRTESFRTTEEKSAAGGMALGDSKALLDAWRNAAS